MLSVKKLQKYNRFIFNRNKIKKNAPVIHLANKNKCSKVAQITKKLVPKTRKKLFKLRSKSKKYLRVLLVVVFWLVFILERANYH